jgi:hypothetical protein
MESWLLLVTGIGCGTGQRWTAVTLSFAHAKGRNYRQLPDRARPRERPCLPISSTLRDRAFPRLQQVARCVFGTEVQAQRSLGFDYTRWQRMKWVANRNLPYMFWNFVGACGARRGALWSISFWALLRLLTVVPYQKSH